MDLIGLYLKIPGTSGRLEHLLCFSLCVLYQGRQADSGFASFHKRPSGSSVATRRGKMEKVTIRRVLSLLCV